MIEEIERSRFVVDVTPIPEGSEKWTAAQDSFELVQPSLRGSDPGILSIGKPLYGRTSGSVDTENSIKLVVSYRCDSSEGRRPPMGHFREPLNSLLL